MTALSDLEDIESIEAYKCTGCDWFEEDEPESPLYECSSCGTRFDRDNSADGSSHRCPDCNKFAAKAADYACPQCQEEVEQVTAYHCPSCEQLLDEEQAGEEACPECGAEFEPEVEEEEQPEEEEAAASAEAETDLDKKLQAHAKLRPVVDNPPKPDAPHDIHEYFTWDYLKWAAEDAILADYNRQMDLDFIEKLDRAAIYPVFIAMPHNDAAHMRVFFTTDGDVDHPSVLDISWDTFKALPKRYTLREEVKA